MYSTGFARGVGFPLVFACVCLAQPGSASAQDATTSLVVQQSANLRTGPATSRSVIRILPVGEVVILLTAHTKNDYLRVAAGTDTGWVFSPLVELSAPQPVVVVPPGNGVNTAPSSYHNCALSGNPSPNGPNMAALQVLNNKKNRFQAPGAGSLDPAFTLANLLRPGPDDARFDDSKAGELEGFVVDVKVGGVETVNCKATDPLFRDTHIEIADRMGAPSTERIIVEVTPRWRAAMQAAGVDWTTATLHSLIGKQVRFRGWVLFDTEHRGQAANTAPGNASDWRATVWELHPVTSFTVLTP